MMSLPPIIDFALGLVFVFFVMSQAASWINEALSAARATRGRYLRQQLANAFRDEVNNLNLGEVLYRHPAVTRLSRRDTRPTAYLPGYQFATALLDTVTDLGKQVTYDADDPAREKPIVRWFDPAQPTAPTSWPTVDARVLTPAEQVERFRIGLLRLRDSQVRELLLGILTAANSDYDKLHAGLTRWYDDYMDRVSGWYKRRQHRDLFWLGLLLAIWFNVDALRLIDGLWRNSQLRTAAAAAAVQVVNSPPAEFAPPPADTSRRATPAPMAPPTVAQLGQRLNATYQTLQALQFPVGWDDPVAVEHRPQSPPFIWTKKEFGPSLLAKLYYLWQWVPTLCGWLITGFAASRGAPFWFDILKRLVNVRGTGPRPPRDSPPPP